MKKYYLLLIVATFSLSGCSLWPSDPIVSDKSWSIERLYSEAKAALDAENYDVALSHYAKLEARFPFGDYAQQALLDTAYAHYKSDNAEAAIASIERFIRVYPLNPHLDYAIYLRGLVNFTRDIGIFEKYIPRDESQRDPASALSALNDFKDLLARYPKSKYSEDATQRIVYLRNRLAQHEVNVGNYYMRRGAYLAAANRGKYVIENYPRTPAMPSALVIMAKAYKVLNLHDLSEDALRILKHNFPGHPGIASVQKTTIN